jgi:hypothetical protein
LSKRTTCPTEMSKKSTCEWNCQKCRGGSTTSRRVAAGPAAVRRGGTLASLSRPSTGRRRRRPAALAGGGMSTWKACRHHRLWHVSATPTACHARTFSNYCTTF